MTSLGSCCLGVVQGIQSRLLDTKAVAEVQAMNEFLEMLSTQVGQPSESHLNHAPAMIVFALFSGDRLVSVCLCVTLSSTYLAGAPHVIP